MVRQAEGLYCDKDCGFWIDNGWGCDQRDADAFCRLKNCDSTSIAIRYEVTPARNIPGFACRGIGEDLGVTTWITGMVHVHFVTDIRANHGGGDIVSNIECSKKSGMYDYKIKANYTYTGIKISCIPILMYLK